MAKTHSCWLSDLNSLKKKIKQAIFAKHARTHPSSQAAKGLIFNPLTVK